MSEKPELSAALKLEIVDQLIREELVKIVLTQQKLIEKLGVAESGYERRKNARLRPKMISGLLIGNWNISKFQIMN